MEQTGQDRVERRLAAILAADVVGYSRLMGIDDEDTLARLKAHQRAIFDPKVAEHHGRIVKTTGDGALVEFASVVDAVRCAVEIQRGMAERNTDVPPERRIEYRIGINVGDIIIDGSDIFGDGVNVAARLEALAEPGGIWVSRAVHEQVRDKLAFGFEDMGEREVKNIARPVNAHRVRYDGLLLADTAATAVPPLGKSAPARPHLRRPLWIAAAAVAVVVAATGAWFTLKSGSNTGGNVASAGRTSIAVLPFNNMSGDPSQDYLSDGITEAILTALARSPTLFVMARNSSFTFKGKAVDVTEAGRKLGVRYVVEGSVQKSADKLRVTAQLIDAQSGNHVWAEKFDRPFKDIFAVQDEITATIAARLGSRLQKAEVDAARSKALVDLSAYDYFLRGRALRQTGAKGPTLESRVMFEKAIEIDPKFALAYAELAYTYYREVALRWDVANRARALAKGVELAEKALALDATLPFAHLVRGDLYLRQHQFDQAVTWVKKAIDLDPNDPQNYAALANVFNFINRNGEGLPLIQKAIALDPLHEPALDMYLGRAYNFIGKFDEAIPHLRLCTSRAPDFWPCHANLAAAYGNSGKLDLARQELAEMRRYYPVKSVKQYRDQSDNQPGPETDRLFKGLNLAGLPAE
jgi:adenylate cyclase